MPDFFSILPEWGGSGGKHHPLLDFVSPPQRLQVQIGSDNVKHGRNHRFLGVNVVFFSHDLGDPLEGLLLPPRFVECVGGIVQNGGEQLVVLDLEPSQHQGRLAEIVPPVVE